MNAAWFRPLVAGLIGILLTAAGSSLHGAIISSIVRSGSTLTPGPSLVNTAPGLQEDTLAFSDRNHQYNGVSVPYSIAGIGMAGAEFVRPDNDDRAGAGYTLAVTLTQTADVFLLIDDRVGDNVNTNGPTLGGTIMPWVATMGFFDTGVNLGVDEVGTAGVGPGAEINNFMSIYKLANVPAGTIVLGAQNDTSTGGPGGRNMYGVAALAPSAAPFLPPPDPPVPYTRPNYALIDLGATGGRPEPGAVPDLDLIRQIGAGADGVNNTNLAQRILLSDTGDEFAITIDNRDETGTPVGALDWRDRGDAYGGSPPFDQPLVRLGEDHVKNNLGVLQVTLEDVPKGVYTVTGFFVDAVNAQSEAIRILVQDGYHGSFTDTGAVGNANQLIGLDGLSTMKMLQRSTSFEVYSDGLNPVRILFDGRAALDKEVPLAGLSLDFTRVPEPSTGVLVLVGLASVLSVRRRRK